MNAAVGEALLRISLSLNYLNGYCWMNIYLRPEIILFNRIRKKNTVWQVFHGKLVLN